MANYTALNYNISIPDYELYSALLSAQNCKSSKAYSLWIWRNDDTLKTKKGSQWLCYFAANPPCCSTPSKSDLTPLTVTPLAGDSFTDAGLIGKTVYLISWNNVTASSGWVQVGDTVTFTDGTIFDGSTPVKLLIY